MSGEKQLEGGLSTRARAAHTVLLLQHKKRLLDALAIGRGNHWFPTKQTRHLRVGDAHGGREEVGRQGASGRIIQLESEKGIGRGACALRKRLHAARLEISG